MRKAIAVLIFMIFASIMYSLPMSGNYTVGLNGDFINLSEASVALQNNAVTGDVNFLMLPGNYDESIIISNINYAFDITIQSQDENNQAIITSSTTTTESNFIIKIHNSDNINIKNLIFNSNETYGNIIQLSGDCDNTLIDGNTFNGNPSSSNSYNTLINFKQIYGENAPDDTIISNNIFNDGSTAINNYSSSSAEGDNTFRISILNNDFNSGYQSINLKRSTDPIIYNNTFNEVRSAVRLDGCYGGVVVSYNSIHARSVGISASIYNTIYGPGKGIFNNKIKTSGLADNGANNMLESHALSVTGEHLRVYYNTMVNYSNHNFTNVASFGGTNGRFRNNNIVNYGNGYALILGNIDPSGSNINIESNNNVFTHSPYAVKISNTGYTTIADYVSANYSDVHLIYNIDPLFDNSMSLTPNSYWLDNKGYDLDGYMVDINGVTRDTETPDIGAMEFDSSTTASAMSGTYEVGPGSIYPTVQSIVNDLVLRGIDGNVQVNLSSGTFTERVQFTKIPRNFSSHTITFEGHISNNSWIESEGTDAKPYVMNLRSNNNLIFNRVNFRNTSVGRGTNVLIDAYAKNLTFNNCTFEQAGEFVSSYSSNSIYVSQDGEVDNLLVDNCTFINGARGVFDWSYTYSSNLIVRNSNFTGIRTPIEASNVDGVLITENNIISYNYRGILINHCENITITKNRVSGSGTAITAGSSGGQETQTPYQNLIANNIVDSNGGNQHGGITLSGDNFDVLYNTIDLKGTNSAGIYQYHILPHQNIIGNILRIENGYAFEGIHGELAETTTIEGNCYFTEHSKFVRFDDISYYDLHEWKLADPTRNVHSVEADPHFNDQTLGSSPWLVNRGFGSNRITDDFFGYPRDVFKDIGAYELSGAVFPYPEGTDNILTVGIGKEYETIQAAFDALDYQGRRRRIDDNAHLDTLYVRIDGGTYTESTLLNHIPREESDMGENYQGYVVIEPANNEEVIFTFPNSDNNQNPLLTILGSDAVIIRNIKFQNNENNYQNLVTVNGRNEILQFNNCTFMIDEVGVAQNSLSFEQTISEGVKISNCNFSGGNYALVTSAENYSGKSNLNFEIFNNTISNAKYGMQLQHIDNIFVHHNEITDCASLMNISYIDGVADVYNNKMVSGNYSGSYSHPEVVIFNHVRSVDVEGYLRFFNNILKIDRVTTQSFYGLSLGYTEYAKIYNNNIEISHDYSYGISNVIKVTSNNNVELKNNVFSGLKQSRALYVSSNEFPFSAVSNNCWYNEGTEFAWINGDSHDDYEDFANIHPELATESFVAYPHINEEGLSESQFLKDKGATPLENFDATDSATFSPYDIGANWIRNNNSTAPLSGTITIGSDFSALEDALENLEKRGVDGDVEILTQTANFENQYTIRKIPNLSGENTLVIRPAENDGTTINYSATSQNDNFIFETLGVSNLTIQGFIMHANGEDYATSIRMRGRSKNLVIDDNIMFGRSTENSNSNQNQIILDDNYHNSLDLLIKRNSFRAGSYAIFKQTNTRSKYTVIRNNHFEQNSYGIDYNYSDFLTINNNRMSNLKNTGINLDDIEGFYKIDGNYITIKGGYGITLQDCYGDFTKYITSNYIVSNPGSTVSALLNFSKTNNLKIAHNTFRGNQTSSYPILKQDYNATDIVYENNILYTEGTGVLADINYPDNMNGARNNLFHTNGEDVVAWGSDNFSTIEGLVTTGMNENSIIADPLFLTSMVELAENSPALNAGADLDYADVSINFIERGSNPDLGAFEHVASPPNFELVESLTFENDESLIKDFSEYSTSLSENLTLTVAGNSDVNVSIAGMVVTFTAPDFEGIDEMTFILHDANTDLSTYQQISIEVTPDTPLTIITPIAFNTNEDVAYSISYSGYLNDDVDVSDVMITANNADHFDITIDGQNVTFIPEENWFGEEMVSLNFFRDINDTPVTHSVLVIVHPINDAPTISFPAEGLTFQEDNVAEINLYDYASDVDTETLIFSSAFNTVDVSISVAGIMTVTPPDNWSGTETITVIVNDELPGLMASSRNQLTQKQTISRLGAVADLQITFDNVNDAPIVANPIFNTVIVEDTEDLLISVENVFADSDLVYGDELTITAIGTDNISAEIVGTNVVINPNENWSGTDVVQIKATDIAGEFVIDEFTVTVGAQNDAPEIILPNAGFAFDEDTTMTIDLSQYISDVDNSDLTISSDGTEHLSISITDLELTITPDSNWNGEELLSITVDDNTRATASDVVNIIVNAVNDAPMAIAVIQDLEIGEDESFTINTLEYFADADIEANDDVLTFTINDSDNINADLVDGIYTFTPIENWFGVEDITITATDSQSSAISQTFTLTVDSVNDAPIIEFPVDGFTLEEDNSIIVNLADFISDVDNDDLTITITTLEELSYELNAMELTITPNANWNGTSQVIIAANDGVARTSRVETSVMVEFHVTSVNDAPHVVDGNFGVHYEEDQENMVINLLEIFGDNDLAYGDELTYGYASDHTFIQIEGNTLTLNYEEHFNGASLFQITARDIADEEASAFINVTIDEVNDEPVVDSFIPTDDSFHIIEEENSTLFEITASDVDSDLTYEWFIDEELQTETSNSLTLSFTENGDYDIKCTVSDEEFEVETEWTVMVDITSLDSALPTLTSLTGNYPNPFSLSGNGRNTATTIKFGVKKNENAKLVLFNLRGQLVKDFGEFESGNHSVLWNGKSNSNQKVSSGVYFYRLQSKSYSSVKKLMIVR